MQINVRIVHAATESTFSARDDFQSARFFSSNQLEWISGRRDGSFTCDGGNNSLTVWFTDVTVFAVEVTA